MPTTQHHPISLSDPHWTVEHIGWAFHLGADAAHDVTMAATFPGAVSIGRRLFWPRAEVDAWFTGQPRLTVADRRRRPRAEPVVTPVVRSSHYRPRRQQSGRAAA